MSWLGALLVAALSVPQAPDLEILHFNDFHGQVLPRVEASAPHRKPAERGGYWRLERYVEERRRELGDRVWVTDGGDWFQGTPEGNDDRGLSVAACFDRLGLTASVVGNHEYDFGERSLIDVIARCAHPVLAANVFERGAPRLRPYVRPYVVKTVAPRSHPDRPLRIAIVGLTTEDTPRLSTGPFGNAEFRDEVETLRALQPVLEREADVVVLLTHCGLRRDRELARRFPHVALILGGHSHTALRRPVVESGVTIVQSGSSGTALTRIEVDLAVDPPAFEILSTRLVVLDMPGEPSADTDEFLQRVFAHIGAKWDQPIGEVRGAADTRRGAGSTPAGNLVAALIREAGGADVGLTNKGGLRSTLRPGPVTRRQVFELLPFDNTVVTVEMTGARLRALLAAGLAGSRRPLEIDGATYRYRVQAGVRELGEVFVGGKPLEAERTYLVATNSFLAGGGDGLEELVTARRVREEPAYLRDLVLRRLAAEGAIDLVAEERIRFEP